MVFVYRGNGGWIFGILALCLAVAAGLERLLLSPPLPLWPVSLAFVIAGLACIALGVQARISPARPVLERQTGRELVRRPVHSAYWVHAEYWGLSFITLAAWLWTFKP